MSGLVTGWVVAHSETEGSLRLVLLVLAHNAGDDGTGMMKVKRLRDQTKLPDAEKAEIALALLAKRGHIELGWKGETTTACYRVTYPGNDAAWLADHTNYQPAVRTPDGSQPDALRVGELRSDEAEGNGTARKRRQDRARLDQPNTAPPNNHTKVKGRDPVGTDSS
ncbi:MAG: hypothetical protein H0U59_03405 [Gemmatimonadaceae bacterium]|nr:hypothetical protein [Gemmatimonadaceae bacterium]